MRNGFNACNNTVGPQGVPTGGMVSGTGFAIAWQNGALKRGDTGVEPNGAFVEDIIAAAQQRLEFFQASRFACQENAHAIACLANALDVLDKRTKAREARGVEGTHQP